MEPCEYCPGRVRPQRVTVDLRRKNVLMVVEDVPAGVCDRCRHRYYDGQVVERLERILAQRPTARRKLRVPVLKFDAVA